MDTFKLVQLGAVAAYTLFVPERFIFTCHGEFKECTKQIPAGASVVVDFSASVYLDSSALGMLLLLRDKFPNIKLANCKKSVLDVLLIANFQKLFQM